MNAHATVYVEVESTLGAVLQRLEGHHEATLSIIYGDREVQPGFHVTEVKAGSFQTLDCGGNPDAWQETILQIEDIPGAGKPQMTAGKFAAILGQVDRQVGLDHDARLTVEIGRPGEPMSVFDVADLSIDGDHAVLRLGIRAAICKPRHRAAHQAASCCAPAAKASGCC
jgi:hypothetical protein